MAMNSMRQRSIGAEITRDRRASAGRRLALVAEPVEEQLVQDHRVHGDQLLALEAIDEKTGAVA